MAKKLKDKNAPKRPLSSFILFGNHMRDTDPEVKDLKLHEQARKIGDMWKNATEEVKEEFNKKAAELKAEYAKKREEYEQTDEYKEFQKLSKEGPKETKTKKRKGPTKMSGYRLFISENKEQNSEDEKDEELAGKGHMARCGIKWSRLSDNEKSGYNDRASKMNPVGNGAFDEEDD